MLMQLKLKKKNVFLDKEHTSPNSKEWKLYGHHVQTRAAICFLRPDGRNGREETALACCV